MNSGSKVRGCAKGFDIDLLVKVKDVKTADNSKNLLHYIVEYYVGHADKVRERVRRQRGVRRGRGGGER